MQVGRLTVLTFTITVNTTLGFPRPAATSWPHLVDPQGVAVPLTPYSPPLSLEAGAGPCAGEADQQGFPAGGMVREHLRFC